MSIVKHVQIFRWRILLTELDFIKQFSKHYSDSLCLLPYIFPSFSGMDTFACIMWLKLHNLLVDLLVPSCYSWQAMQVPCQQGRFLIPEIAQCAVSCQVLRCMHAAFVLVAVLLGLPLLLHSLGAAKSVLALGQEFTKIRSCRSSG